MQFLPFIFSGPLRAAALFAIALTLGVPGSRAAAPAASIFNGQDLSGWEGNPAFWSVRDGAITGQTTAERPTVGNTFLIWKGGEVKNFEFRALFRLTGQNDKEFGNSGVQYRSRVVDATKFVVGGYQADIDLGGKYIGMLYEEKGRGILMKPGEVIRVNPMAAGQEKPTIDVIATPTTPEDIRGAYKRNEWNELLIVAQGNHLQHFLNGKLTADITDNDPVKGAAAGILALQLHSGQPMTIQFKDLKLTVLP